MVERNHRPPVASFFMAGALVAGDHVALESSAATHARVRRLEAGDAIRLLDGRGRIAYGALANVTKREVTATVQRVVQVPRHVALEVIVPIADRDRMLLAAEKCVELQVTGWRPAYFARSRSVSPRGEGRKFREKVVARMQSALEQSGGAWMPDVHDDADARDAIRAAPDSWNRVLLDSSGESLARLVSNEPTIIAVGPEGGIEQHEIDAAKSDGWSLASLGATTLRFETAVIAAAAVVRAAQH